MARYEYRVNGDGGWSWDQGFAIHRTKKDAVEESRDFRADIKADGDDTAVWIERRPEGVWERADA